jgi:hypothetical protein
MIGSGHKSTLLPQIHSNPKEPECVSYTEQGEVGADAINTHPLKNEINVERRLYRN